MYCAMSRHVALQSVVTCVLVMSFHVGYPEARAKFLTFVSLIALLFANLHCDCTTVIIDSTSVDAAVRSRVVTPAAAGAGAVAVPAAGVPAAGAPEGETRLEFRKRRRKGWIAKWR